jgi:hypothetical protein
LEFIAILRTRGTKRFIRSHYEVARISDEPGPLIYVYSRGTRVKSANVESVKGAIL